MSRWSSAMASTMLLTLWLSCSLLSTSCATAQDLEVFQKNSFLDPRLLDSGDEEISLNLLSLQTAVGYIRDYQSRYVFTQANAAVASAVVSLYSGTWQFELAGLEFDRDPSTQLTSIDSEETRVSIGVHRYFQPELLVPGKDENGNETNTTDTFYTRAGAQYERSRTVAGNHIESLNLGFEGRFDDLPQTLVGFHYSYVRSEEGLEELNRHYLSLTTHSLAKRFGNGHRIDGAFAIGAERTLGHTKFSSIRWLLKARFAIPKIKSEVQLSYSPAWQPKNRDHPRDWNHEVGVLLSSHLWTRIFERPR